MQYFLIVGLSTLMIASFYSVWVHSGSSEITEKYAVSILLLYVPNTKERIMHGRYLYVWEKLPYIIYLCTATNNMF